MIASIYGVIQSMKVAEIMETVDRALFVLDGSPAYEDSPMQIGFNATISAPHMHATCLQLLEKNLQPGMHALDVGSALDQLMPGFDPCHKGSYLRSYVPPVDECIFRPWYSSSLVVENGICYHFVPYVRVHDSPDSSKLKVENFCFLPKMIFDKHEDLRMTNTQTPPTVVNTTGAPVTNAVANHAEKPEKFNGQNFKRWHQKIRSSIITTLGLARFLKRNLHLQVDKPLEDPLYNGYCKNTMPKNYEETFWNAIVQDLQVLLHDIHAEGMTLSETFQVAAIIEKLPPSWVDRI
ncbi:pol polyprotein [Tanacetum coccineum]